MLGWEFLKAVYSDFRERVLFIAAEHDSTADPPDATGRGFESVQPLGLRARPRDPDVDGDNIPTTGAGVLIAWDGSEGFALPVGDPRALDKMPEGQQGSTYLHNTGDRPSYYGIEGDGSHQALAQYPNGERAHSISMEVHDGGNEHLTVRHGEGHAVQLLAGGAALVSSKNGKVYVEVSDDGIVFNGSVKLNGGVLIGDVTTGQPIATKADLDELRTALIATFTGLQCVAPGGPTKLTAPFVALMPGSSKAKASP